MGIERETSSATTPGRRPSGDVTDDQLVRAALRDRGMFAEIYDRYADRIYRYALHKTSSPQDADDITSETMISALESLQSFDPERGSFSAWLFTIASRRISDHYRYRRRFWRFLSQASRAADADPIDETVDTVMRTYEYQEIRAELASLKPADQEIILLRYSAGLNSTEIGEILSISPANARVRLQRARQRLAQGLGSINE